MVPLTVDEVVEAIIGTALRSRPMEMMLPQSRGVVAKFANIFPQTSGRFVDIFQKQGLKRQAKSK
jgi:3-oxoacyl-[acyl-carrier protein] reductase